MTNEEMVQLGYPPELYPWLYPDLFPDYVTPSPSLDSAFSTDPMPDPDTTLSVPPSADTSAPVEVVTVDELLDRLNQGDGGDPQPEESETVGDPADPGDTLAVDLEPGDLAVIDAIKGVRTELAQISEQLADMQLSEERPLLTTSFADYTVTEGLLLLLLLSVFLSACYKLLRGGFQWLRS